MRRGAIIVLVAVGLAACAEPPSKEMNQAQGAIDAARAAGAEQFAAAELSAAVEALGRSEAAVTQRDYRLALHHAIESRERAQGAAKAAGSARSRSRGDAERLLAEASSLLPQAQERLRDADIARVPRRLAEDARRTIEEAETSVQNARSALDRDESEQARQLLEGVSVRIRTTISLIEKALGGTPGKRRR